MSRSYFTKFVFTYFKRTRAMLQQMASLQADQQENDKLFLLEHPKGEQEAEALSKCRERTSDVLKVCPELKPLGNQFDALLEESKRNRLSAAPVYQSQDPIRFHLIRHDDYLAYWRSERRTNYKQGREDTLGPVFETPECFQIWTTVMTDAIARGKAVVDGKMERAAFQDFTGTVNKEFKQFCHDISRQYTQDSQEEKKESEVSEKVGSRELRAFIEIIRLVATVLIPLESEFLQVDKEGKNAVEVIKSIVANESIKNGIATLVSKTNELAGTLREDCLDAYNS